MQLQALILFLATSVAFVQASEPCTSAAVDTEGREPTALVPESSPPTLLPELGATEFTVLDSQSCSLNISDSPTESSCADNQQTYENVKLLNEIHSTVKMIEKHLDNVFLPRILKSLMSGTEDNKVKEFIEFMERNNSDLVQFKVKWLEAVNDDPDGELDFYHKFFQSKAEIPRQTRVFYTKGQENQLKGWMDLTQWQKDIQLSCNFFRSKLDSAKDTKQCQIFNDLLMENQLPFSVNVLNAWNNYEMAQQNEKPAALQMWKDAFIQGLNGLNLEHVLSFVKSWFDKIRYVAAQKLNIATYHYGTALKKTIMKGLASENDQMVLVNFFKTNIENYNFMDWKEDNYFKHIPNVATVWNNFAEAQPNAAYRQCQKVIIEQVDELYKKYHNLREKSRQATFFDCVLMDELIENGNSFDALKEPAIMKLIAGGIQSETSRIIKSQATEVIKMNERIVEQEEKFTKLNEEIEKLKEEIAILQGQSIDSPNPTNQGEGKSKKKSNNATAMKLTKTFAFTALLVAILFA